MLERMYNRLLLMVLPSVEQITVKLRKLLVRLDKLTDRLEIDMELRAQALGRRIAEHRVAMEALEQSFAKDRARRATAIDKTQQSLDAALEARAKVAGLIQDAD